MGNLILLKWTLSPVPLHLAIWRDWCYTCSRIDLIWYAMCDAHKINIAHRTLSTPWMHSKSMIIFCGNCSVISGCMIDRKMYILISSESKTGNCNLYLCTHVCMYWAYFWPTTNLNVKWSWRAQTHLRCTHLTEVHIAHLITIIKVEAVESSSRVNWWGSKERKTDPISMSVRQCEPWGKSNWHQKKPADRLSVVKCTLHTENGSLQQ